MVLNLVLCALPGMMADWLLEIQRSQVWLFILEISVDNLSARILWQGVI